MSEASVIENNTEVTQVSYTPDMILLILQTYGIIAGVRPISSVDDSGKKDIYLTPLLATFPASALLEDLIAYFLVRGKGAGDRRVGFFVQSAENKLFVLSLELTGWKPDLAEEIRQELAEKKPTDLKIILEDTGLIDKFRQLYTKAEAVIIGLDSDKSLVEKIEPLIANAYSFDIPINFIPVENEQYRDVYLVQDIASMLKTGRIVRRTPAQDLFYQQRDLCKQTLRVAEDQFHAYEKIMRGLEAYAKNFQNSTDMFNHEKNKQLN
jgi:hypothetical protein